MARSPNKLEQTLADDGIVEESIGDTSNEPVYKVLGDSKIPVSKFSGALWCSRRDQGIAARANDMDCWDEAIKYHENNQANNRVSKQNSSGNTPYTQRMNEQWTETENVVFSNTSIMVPLLYPKNPNIKISYSEESKAPISRAVERLCNRLMQMKTAPGLNMKPKIRRVILTTLLTNAGYLKLSWINKTESSEEAIANLTSLAQKLANAKKTSEIREIEGQIMALEQRVNLLSDAGPLVTHRLPQHIIVDPTSTDQDPCVDANWMMEWDYLPTAYINAVYAKDGKSIYEPTHVMKAGSKSNGVEDEVNNFTLIADDSASRPEAYGYTSAAQLGAAEYCKVWWVWDKTTRRVSMYHDQDWKWPIWVWDDPLRLPRFFPYFKLWFHESAVSTNGKGEVTYYLDQQDAINEINDEVRRSRRWVRRNLFYNKEKISQEDVEAVLKGPDGTARGISLPDGETLDSAIMSMKPPSMMFPELFNPDSKFAAINRITGISDAMRGGQFKTNTTNRAIDFYNSNVEVRVDERKDLIEEFTADVMWNVAMLCLMNWGPENVAPIIGQELAQAWEQISDPRVFNTEMQPQIEAGSTQKPNSAGSKQEALELAQIIGQFANASPGLVLVILKIIERTFPETAITDEERKMIIESMMMNMQKAGGGPNEGEQGSTQEGQASEGGGDDAQLRQQLAQEISNLPPEAQQALQQLIEQGVPPEQALQQIMQGQ